MQAEAAENLIEAIYDAAVEPAEWAQVMGAMKSEFRTDVEGLYMLDAVKNTMQPIHIDGIADPHLRSFQACFYTDDNPCIRSEPLHRPGVVRTDQRLLAYFNDPHVLRRSLYYNHWMRPQDLEHTLGTTVTAEGCATVNLTFLRSSVVGVFHADEVATFTRFCRHLRRSLQIARHLGTLDSLQRVSLDLLDVNTAAVLLVEATGQIAFANHAALAMAEAGDGLALGDDGLRLLRRSDQQKLASLIGRALAGKSGGAMPALRPSGKRPYSIMVSPLSRGRAETTPVKSALCIVVVDPETSPVPPVERLRQLHGLTPAEAALAVRLAAGDDLRTAATVLGILYSTARSQLTAIFRKTHTRRQGELIRLLLTTALLPTR